MYISARRLKLVQRTLSSRCESVQKRDWGITLDGIGSFMCSWPLLLVFAIVFYYLPFSGLSIASLDYNTIMGFSGAEFIGFDAFKEIFIKKYLFRRIFIRFLGTFSDVICLILYADFRCL